MPVTIAADLPARAVLEAENVFVMTEHRATHQDIRPLRIAIVNLMPTKQDTETHVLRLLSNTPLQVKITLLHMSSHHSRNTSSQHLRDFYATFEQVRDKKFDGLVITGAPVEHLPFEQVDYWQELCQLMSWSRTHVFSTLHVCWGAQAGLYYHYGIGKHHLPSKMFGVFTHHVHHPHHPLLRGFDEVFAAPHSRHTEIKAQEVADAGGLEVLADSAEAGVYLAASLDGREVFVVGHPEYDRDTLRAEYQRDLAKGLDVPAPRHYFPDNNPDATPLMTWRSHGFLLYSNWLNYCVYQRTPYDLSSIPSEGTGEDSSAK